MWSLNGLRLNEFIEHVYECFTNVGTCIKYNVDCSLQVVLHLSSDHTFQVPAIYHRLCIGYSFLSLQEYMYGNWPVHIADVKPCLEQHRGLPMWYAWLGIAKMLVRNRSWCNAFVKGRHTGF